jgi:sodium/potassium-transporting ATPase subunit alpha
VNDAAQVGHVAYVDPTTAPADEHRLLLHDLFARFVTDPANGLSQAQARANLELYGLNEINSAIQVPEWVRFCKNVFGGSSLLLWTGVLLCFANYSIEVGKHEDPPLENVFLGLALIVVIFVTGTLSFIQESRTASLARQYEQMQEQTATVIREAIEMQVPAEELVLGDILIIRTGDRIPADCRILESNNLMVDNSALTGESEPLDRDMNCTHDDQMMTKNMAFSSTWAVQGNGKAVVTRTGINTVMGKITELTVQSPKEETLITKEVSQFIHITTCVAVTLGMFFFIVSFILGYFWVDSILFLIGVIVANVPEGLLAVVTISLSLSAKRLSSRNCIVKNLETVETLGATSIILCDKTGTLTKNQVCKEMASHDVSF